MQPKFDAAVKSTKVLDHVYTLQKVTTRPYANIFTL